MERQRQLERCGWTFWRVRGGQFYRDPDTALHPLWQVLDERKIYPKHQWEEEQRKNEEVTPETDENYATNVEDENIPDSSGGDETDMKVERRDDDRLKGKKPPEIISARAIRNAIIAALEKCPNNTCTAKSIAGRVLKEISIITRGNPRLEFERRVTRNIGVLKQKGHIEEYQSKNKRLRLLRQDDLFS
jgi:hypothetical protein